MAAVQRLEAACVNRQKPAALVFFLHASVYQALPDWTYPFFAALPSIEIVENLNRILNGDGLLLFESLLLPLWMTVLVLWI
ncbi:hypothetical protein NST99_18360 [Paenibacillus sp. FSL L8-0470]|uniref:hypothetical protein n=1 Tax=unclassified Paenibacillus TaxID=185978 RepID=UPI0030FC1BE6